MVGQNSISVPYKIDTGSNGNIMPLHIFKKLFPGVTNVWLVETINKHILLKHYNKRPITQLGTCKVTIEHKNNRKKSQFFVVPGNGQALLGMLDTEALQINNININSIDTEDAGNSEQNINTGTTQASNTKQETDGAMKCCENTDSISKSTNNSIKSMADTNENKPTITFFQVQAMTQTKGKVLN